MFNNEKQLYSGIDRSIKKDRENRDAAYLLENESENRIRENEFTDIFGSEEVEKDLLLVQSIKKNFTKHIEHLDADEIRKIKEGKQRADALEVIISEAGELYDWAGPEANFLRSSEYDDLVNGVDIIIEFDIPQGSDAEPKRIALAIDASMNAESEVVLKKMKRNIRKIMEESDEKPVVKYFKSNVTDYKGSLPIVIPVIVGLEGTHVDALISEYASLKKLKKISNPTDLTKKTIKDLQEKLASHPAQSVFYSEIVSQLRHYETIIPSSTGANKDEIAFEIRSVLEKFTDIASQKDRIPYGAYADDGIFARIKSFASNE